MYQFYFCSLKYFGQVICSLQVYGLWYRLHGAGSGLLMSGTCVLTESDSIYLIAEG